MDFVRLWLHEATRVYGDKLVEEKDIANLQKLKMEIVKATFEVSIHIQYRLSLPAVTASCHCLLSLPAVTV